MAVIRLPLQSSLVASQTLGNVIYSTHNWLVLLLAVCFFNLATTCLYFIIVYAASSSLEKLCNVHVVDSLENLVQRNCASRDFR
jgi:hypothetical protein